MRCWSAFPRSDFFCRSGTRTLLLAVVLAAVARPVPVHAQSAATGPQPVDASRLLAAFAKMPGLEARFVEEKHLTLLARPLRSEGVLYFAHPGRLLRVVTAPSPSRVLVTPEKVIARDAEGEKVIDLAARPDFKPFVESLVWILAGDEASLRRVYGVEFRPAEGDAPWELTLKPKRAPLDRLIAHLRIRGEGLAVREIEVLETAGNRTHTRIVEANPARTFDARERRELFGLAAEK